MHMISTFFQEEEEIWLKIVTNIYFYRIQKDISYFIIFFRQFNSESRDIKTHFAWSTPRTSKIDTKLTYQRTKKGRNCMERYAYTPNTQLQMTQAAEQLR